VATTAVAVARELGVAEVKADLLPEQKAAAERMARISQCNCP
jgi:cation transport ATPase